MRGTAPHALIGSNLSHWDPGDTLRISRADRCGRRIIFVNAACVRPQGLQAFRSHHGLTESRPAKRALQTAGKRAYPPLAGRVVPERTRGRRIVSGAVPGR